MERRLCECIDSGQRWCNQIPMVEDDKDTKMLNAQQDDEEYLRLTLPITCGNVQQLGADG